MHFCFAVLAAIAVIASASSDACGVVTSPAPCGQSYDTEAQCEARGCCYNANFPKSPCFYPGADADPIKYVHIIQACHFDAGFADSTVGILNRWWYTHFPQAIKLGSELHGANASLGLDLKFMAQSYIISLYFDCPPNIPGLPCPSDVEKNATATAIANGWITWHAFPYNGEAELMSAPTLAAGFAMTHALDAQFGQAPKATMSQRDVPGTTRSIIPVLLANGITALSEGVNDASAYALVPRLFLWRDPISQLSIPYFYHPHGYGGIGWEDIIQIPAFEHALVLDWRGDNAGPPQSVDEVLADYTNIRTLFPGATVFASTFDNFTSYLTTDILDLLPVIDSEVGDTWIHGSTSDPWKSAWFKAAQLAIADCLASGQCSPSDPALLNATRHILKNGEHTWGRDIKTFLHDQSNWSNAQLAAQLAANSSNFILTQGSWDEQRYFGIELAMEALPDGHPLKAALQEAWDNIHPGSPPATAGWTPATLGPAGLTSVGRWTIGLDAITGAIGYLKDTSTGITWANASTTNTANASDAPCGLGWLHYQSYNSSDYTSFMDSYCSYGSNPPSWFLLDFGKPNCSEANPVHYEVDQSVINAWQQTSGTGLSYLVQSRLSPDGTDVLHTYYGAPSEVWTRIDVPGTGAPNPAVNVTIWIFDKTGTRLPESMFVRFNPSAAVGTAGPGDAITTWYAGKIGEWVNASDVVQQGNQRHHGVTDGIRFVKSDSSGANGTLTVTSAEAAVSCFGHPTGFPTPSTASLAPFDPKDGQGASFYVEGNIWGTNYPAWVPWDPKDANMMWTFSIAPGMA